MKIWMITLENNWYLYNHNNGGEMWELLLGANWQEIIQENYNDMRNCTLSELSVKCHSTVYLRLTPVSVNGNHHWL